MTALTGVSRTTRGTLLPAEQAELSGIDTARLMAEVVPALQARADVEVRVVPGRVRFPTTGRSTPPR